MFLKNYRQVTETNDHQEKTKYIFVSCLNVIHTQQPHKTVSIKLYDFASYFEFCSYQAKVINQIKNCETVSSRNQKDIV